MPSGLPKHDLRRQLRAHRRHLSAARDRVADSRALAERATDLVAELGLPAGSTVTAYTATPVEPPTEGLITALQHAGLRVLLPITLPDLDLDWRDAADHDGTTLDGAVLGEIDLVLAPGLSVDPDGTRLGQGGGCYDRVLPRLRPGTPVVVVLHPGEERTEPLPAEAHDQPVDAVLTADGHHWLRPRPA